jgi:hypothetical protein
MLAAPARHPRNLFGLIPISCRSQARRAARSQCFWSIRKDSGLGHASFYCGEDAAHIWTLGGNENDMVQIGASAKDCPSFGLIGYFWPQALPLPKSGTVMVSVGSAVSVQSPPADASAPTASSAGASKPKL